MSAVSDDVEAALGRLRISPHLGVSVSQAKAMAAHIEAQQQEIERLRGALERVGGGRFWNVYNDVMDDLAKASAEIERLRGLLREHGYCYFNRHGDLECKHCGMTAQYGHVLDCPMAAALAGEAKP